MKQIKGLDLKALEKRIVKATETKEALRDVTPFTLDPGTDNTKNKATFDVEIITDNL